MVNKADGQQTIGQEHDQEKAIPKKPWQTPKLTIDLAIDMTESGGGGNPKAEDATYSS